MNLELNNKRVLVTGSSRGIGLAIVKAFVAEGCRVVANARTENSLIEAISDIENCRAVVADVSDPAGALQLVGKAADLLDGLDVIICNVGSGTSVPPGDENYAEWQRVLAVNLFSATNMVEASREEMRKANGTIVCISSICGCELVLGAPITYSVAKSALNAYVKAISRPLARDGIRINAVAPGNISFDGSGWERRFRDSPESVRIMLNSEVALARFGTANEVADLVLWLSSQKSSFATGAVWELDGGQIRS